ncbi:Arc family DNA-binding protein [uncultured Ruegeria sp.]|uniref:Arc family DNA-binding protein n=1 Tax=uncultured Ruegeria sp. TaxID=259304 RepID=UPI002630B126|nr:Arc family DNA-binding protein [uncultured Ruegeria sp.]
MVQKRAGSGGTVGVMVRMPEGLRDRVKLGADSAGRSMNSEIVGILEKKYPKPIDLEDYRMVMDLLGILATSTEEQRSTFIRLVVDSLTRNYGEEDESQVRKMFESFGLQFTNFEKRTNRKMSPKEIQRVIDGATKDMISAGLIKENTSYSYSIDDFEAPNSDLPDQYNVDTDDNYRPGQPKVDQEYDEELEQDRYPDFGPRM